MLFCCHHFPHSFPLSSITSFAQVFIAAVNLFFVWYIFKYQRTKDSRIEGSNLVLQRQNIKLQWFKELIIQPNLNSINDFYEKINSISEGLLVAGISDQEKINISDGIKEEQSKLRKSFVDILKAVDGELEMNVKSNLDKLIEEITLAIFDRGINLSHAPAFEREIANRITYSKNDLIKLIFNYKATD